MAQEPTVASLVMPFAGLMQSCSTSRHRSRPTERVLPKSMVIGAVGNALGLKRNDDIDELASLRMGVRVDEPGLIMTDFITAQGVLSADGLKVHSQYSRTMQYLADAAFLVALEGDYYLLEEVHAALAVPTSPIYLGRRGYYPSIPLFVIDGLREESLEEAIAAHPHVLTNKAVQFADCHIEGKGKMVYDQPVSFASHTFGPRRVYRCCVSELGARCTSPN